MSKAYVEDTAMADWKTRIDTINKDCISEIESIEKSMNSLPDVFKGDYAEIYGQSFEEYTKSVKSSHESLQSFENFLDKIVEVMRSH